ALRHMGPDSGILAAHDAFEDEGQIVIVSEPPHGTTLDHLLRDGLDLTGAQRLSYLGQLVDAVGHAHASGVIHRRIRPGVIVIDGDRLRLGGFDHARIPAERTIHHDPASIDVDADGGYIAPEVLDPQVGPATAATDLFSVGAIAWSLWSGERLPGEWTARGEPLERPEGMPAGVWDVVATLLRVEPDARTATLDDLQDAIAHAGATSHDPRSPD